MKNNELIADKLEEIIGGMFAYFRSLDSGATEYSIFHNPRNHAFWFILIFFTNKDQLYKALNNGVCYQMHSYLLNKIDGDSDGLNIERFIFFEPGNRPVDKIEIDHLFELLLKKQEALNKIYQDNVKECKMCGHDFDKHQLLCNLNEDNAAPVEGWITCPEDNCNCFQTWSADYKTAVK